MAGRVALSLVSLLLTLVVLEVGIRTLDIPPDGFLRTRAAQRWYQRHWTPVNRFGYRDFDREYMEIRSKRGLIVLGDSFAAGSGVEDVRDRFANLLGAELGEEWTVHVVAIPGWSTADESLALADFPYDPDVVLLSFYMNDIEGAAKRLGQAYRPDVSIRPAFLAPLVQRSDLVNFVYWRLANSRVWSDHGDYAEWIYGRFAADDVWKVEVEQLTEVLETATARDAAPMAVLFPHLWDVEGSAPALGRVAAFLTERGVPFLDVSELIRDGDWDASTLFAASHDPHPSPALHRAVAQALAPKVPR